MESLDFDAFDAIVGSLCLHCTPQPQLHGPECAGKTCDSIYDLCTVRGTEYTHVSALAALCLTSKRANESATRHLYHRPACLT